MKTQGSSTLESPLHSALTLPQFRSSWISADYNRQIVRMIDMPIITLILKVLPKTYYDKKRDKNQGRTIHRRPSAKRINVCGLPLVIAETHGSHQI
jgi:hypothetical protein